MGESSAISSIAFLAGQTEHDDDHEHDREKFPRFFIVLVLAVVLDCFPRQQIEDNDDHEYDQEFRFLTS